MKNESRKVALLLITFVLFIPLGWAHSTKKAEVSAVPFTFDPFNSHLVEAEWEDGIGCPNNQPFTGFLPPDFSTLGPEIYGSPACSPQTGATATNTGADPHVEGLFMSKVGPTGNDASAGAVINGFKGQTLSELGFDIRKDSTGFPAPNPQGSHCGAGAPRFNINLKEDTVLTYFAGCSHGTTTTPDGSDWTRVRFDVSPTSTEIFSCSATACDINPTPIPAGFTIKSISVVFDEGTDASGGPDSFGFAILDNIDVNGTLIGKGEKTQKKDGDD